jgi:hypothetical protein
MLHTITQPGVLEYTDLYSPSPEMLARLAPKMDGNRILVLLDFMHARVAGWYRLGLRHWEWTLQEPTAYHDRVAYWCEKLAYENFQIWHYLEDNRTTNWMISRNQSQIDARNQARHDAMTALDTLFLEVQEASQAGSEYDSETLGSIIDRATVNRMWIYHMLILDRCTLKYINYIQELINQYTFLRYRAACLIEQMQAGQRLIQPVTLV